MMTENQKQIARVALEELIEKAGTQRSLAEALDVDYSTVCAWKTRTGYLPLRYVPRAAKIYGVSPKRLRPDYPFVDTEAA